MVVLTENATTAIRTLVGQSESPETAGVRIASTDTGPQALTLSAALSPEEGDEVVESGGARVFLESGAAAMLDDQVLDAEVDPQGSVTFRSAPQ